MTVPVWGAAKDTDYADAAKAGEHSRKDSSEPEKADADSRCVRQLLRWPGSHVSSGSAYHIGSMGAAQVY